MSRAGNLRPPARLSCAWAPACAALLSLTCAALLALAGTAAAEPVPGPTRIVHAPGKLVPIPASIPHEEGDMVDSRILPDLRWIDARYPIYVTDGYSGPLPNGEWVGCHGCHAANSDHTVGLAVDIVPAEPTSTCDSHWAAITRLALWAEPVQNKPVAPFRWVGYNGDAGHGCGNHLHLSWNHAETRPYQLAEWVEVFPTSPAEVSAKPRGKRPPANRAPSGPAGGVSQVTTGGLGPHASGD